MKAQIALLGGDGIGPEVLAQARRILDTIANEDGHQFHIVEGLIGGAAIDAHGEPLPEVTRQLCLQSRAVLLGAVGSTKHDHLPPD